MVTEYNGGISKTAGLNISAQDNGNQGGKTLLSNCKKGNPDVSIKPFHASVVIDSIDARTETEITRSFKTLLPLNTIVIRLNTHRSYQMKIIFNWKLIFIQNYQTPQRLPLVHAAKLYDLHPVVWCNKSVDDVNNSQNRCVNSAARFRRHVNSK